MNFINFYKIRRIARHLRQESAPIFSPFRRKKKIKKSPSTFNVFFKKRTIFVNNYLQKSHFIKEKADLKKTKQESTFFYKSKKTNTPPFFRHRQSIYKTHKKAKAFLLPVLTFAFSFAILEP